VPPHWGAAREEADRRRKEEADRLVISREEADRVGARKVNGCCLVLELVDGERDSGAAVVEGRCRSCLEILRRPRPLHPRDA
jgi:hypothetical protein